MCICLGEIGFWQISVFSVRIISHVWLTWMCTLNSVHMHQIQFVLVAIVMKIQNQSEMVWIEFHTHFAQMYLDQLLGFARKPNITKCFLSVA